MTEAEQRLRRVYEAFNARDIEAALAFMHPDVDWPNALEGGREQGQAAVREYWTRQFKVIRSRVDPERFELEPDGRVAVHVHQVVLNLCGDLVSDRHVRHVYTLRDDLIERMDVVDQD